MVAELPLCTYCFVGNRVLSSIRHVDADITDWDWGNGGVLQDNGGDFGDGVTLRVECNNAGNASGLCAGDCRHEA